MLLSVQDGVCKATLEESPAELHYELSKGHTTSTIVPKVRGKKKPDTAQYLVALR